jgi:hypothetical protein
MTDGKLVDEVIECARDALNGLSSLEERRLRERIATRLEQHGGDNA